MSKPLATKVSTPLSDNVQIGPKVSKFCVTAIIFQHCLNPLGHGVHQSFTGCHWSPLPLLNDYITELVDVRDLTLLHLPFEDSPQITFTLSFFSKAVVVLEVYLGSLSCWNTATQPSLWREGIMLCFSMSQYMLAFMVPSMNCSSPMPAAPMQPQTMTLPPPCFTVGKTHLSLYSSPGCCHTRLTPSEPNKLILVSSDHRADSSNPCPFFACLQQTVFGLSCASSLEDASFWDDSHTDRFDAVCGVWSEHWQADPPTPSTSAAMLAALIRLFPKHNLWIRRWAHTLNFFGRPWRGLFWVEPLLLNSVSGSWQSSYSLHHLYVKQQFFFFLSSESYLPWGTMLNFQWLV